MKVTHFSLAESLKLTRLVNDYLHENASLRSLVTFFPSIEAVAQVVQSRSENDVDRNLLVQVLVDQNRLINLAEASATNLRRLTDPTVFTVTTGHQLCLATGPLYSVYKVLSVIQTCQQLNQAYPSNHFVPVFWMASEDHDFAEVNHVHLFGKKLTWESQQTGAVGEFDTPEVRELVEEAIGMMGNQEHSLLDADMLRKAYLQPNLAAATRYLMNALFGRFGLLVIDGNDRSLKKQFARIMADELFAQSAAGIVGKTNEKLESMGYSVQVKPRPVNLFFIQPGQRTRLDSAEDGAIGLSDGTRKFSTEELESLLEKTPDVFSPNVILRPLYQETILPNVAYIGGPGEVAYWLQLKTLFDHHAIPFPLVMLRDSAILIDDYAADRMRKVGLQPADLFQAKEILIRQLVGNEYHYSLESYRQELLRIFADVAAKAREADPSLEAAALAEGQKQAASLENFEKRIMKALKNRESVKLQQFEKVWNAIYPEEELQERHDNYFEYSSRFGPGLIDFLISSFDPFAKEGHIVFAQ